MQIEFSVAMAVYCKDDPRHFAEAVHSIYTKQVFKPSEIIIVVDGPIPETIESILLELAKEISVIKIIRFPINRGHAAARQAGIESASNDIVALMDSDDISLPLRFKKQMEFLALHPEVAVVGGQITEFIDRPDNIVGKRVVSCENDKIYAMLKQRCPFNQVTIALRRKPCLKLGGYLDWYCDEDYYLWIRMAQAGYKFANLPDVLVNVRVGRDMYARRGGWKYFKSEKGLQDLMLRKKMISLPRYCYNVLGRFAIQVAMPNRIRAFVFQKLFRK